MKLTDAANILGITGEVTKEIVKKAYRTASKKYHPDINPAGEEMMKVVNEAYEVLKAELEKGEKITVDKETTDYPQELADALNAIVHLQGLEIEICGVWAWISGDTKTHKEALKAAKYKWASKKKQWYFRPAEWKSFGRGKASMEDIRSKYGSSKIPTRHLNSIGA